MARGLDRTVGTPCPRGYVLIFLTRGGDCSLRDADKNDGLTNCSWDVCHYAALASSLLANTVHASAWARSAHPTFAAITISAANNPLNVKKPGCSHSRVFSFKPRQAYSACSAGLAAPTLILALFLTLIASTKLYSSAWPTRPPICWASWLRRVVSTWAGCDTLPMRYTP